MQLEMKTGATDRWLVISEWVKKVKKAFKPTGLSSTWSGWWSARRHAKGRSDCSDILLGIVATKKLHGSQRGLVWMETGEQ